MNRQSELIVLIISVVIAAILCWLEFRRTQKRFRLLRMTAAFAAVAALTLLAIPVSYTSLSLVEPEVVIVTTDGVQRDSLAAFERFAGRDVSRYSANELWKLSSAAHCQVHVFGYGLSATELERISGTSSIVPHLTAPSGIVQIHWQQQLLQGQPLLVQGRYNNTGTTPVQLQLSGQHTLLDSCTIAAGTDTLFQLQALPVHKEKALYQLTTLSGKDTLSKEPVPVVVNSHTPLSVLILAAAPGFEYRFLTNWLTDNGYSIASRTAISKNKYQFSYANHRQVALEQLTPATLSQFDVVVTDAAALQTAAPAELTALREQIATRAMGMVVLADSSKLPAWLSTASLTVQQAGAVPQNLTLSVPGTGNAALPASLPLYITPSAALLPLYSDVQQHLRVAAGLYGAGHVVMSTLTNTYSWQLAGNQQTYAAVWSTLLQQAARPDFTAQQWFTAPALPVVHQPAVLYRNTTDSTIAPPLVNGHLVAPAQQQLLPFIWQGSYWPVHSGWQTIPAANSNTPWYAYLPEHWKMVRAMEKRAVTLEHAYLQKNTSGTKKQPAIVNHELPPVYAWILLLAACTFLWWEGKTRYTDRKKR